MWLKSDRNENEVKPTKNNVDIPKNLVSRDNSKKRVVSMFWLFCVDLYSTNSLQGANRKKGKHKKWFSMKYKKKIPLLHVWDFCEKSVVLCEGEYVNLTSDMSKPNCRNDWMGEEIG